MKLDKSIVQRRVDLMAAEGVVRNIDYLCQTQPADYKHLDLRHKSKRW